MTTTKTSAKPRVWIGCLHCYACGRLVGEWFDAADADEVTLDDIHANGPVEGCEELWVMDMEYMPEDREMSPHRAKQWADLIEEVGEDNAQALGAWVRSGECVVDGDDLPTAEDFLERYAGEWDSWDEYVEYAASEMDILDKMPEHLTPYFDFKKWGRDLAYDYVVVDARPYGVHIFRSL